MRWVCEGMWSMYRSTRDTHRAGASNGSGAWPWWSKKVHKSEYGDRKAASVFSSGISKVARSMPRPALFSLHIGKSAELGDAPVPPKLSRAHIIGDVRTHIRVPGGVFAVTIHSGGQMVYAAVNAGPMEVNGLVCVRWKPPQAGTCVATLWKQRDKLGSKPVSVASFLDTCTKVTQFSFVVL